MYVAVASHASQLCGTSMCRAHAVTWAAVASPVRKWRNWHILIAASKAASQAPAHRSSFCFLEKGDYTFEKFCGVL